MNKGAHLAAVALLFLVIGLPPGCSTAGVRFDTANVSKIARGNTTKKGIRGYFGDPLRTEIGPAGEIWTYTYVETHATAGGMLGHVTVGVDQSETVMNTLTVVFDGELVKDFSFSNGSHTDTYLK